MNEQDYGELVYFLTTRKLPERIVGQDASHRLAKTAFRKRSKNYEFCENTGKLYFRKGTTKLRVVRASERELLFREFHDSQSGGHRGLNVTFKRISNSYYWRGLMSYLKVKVKQCPVCQNRELLQHTKTAGGMATGPLTTHVLDTARGCPASNLGIEVYYLMAGQWKKLSGGSTNRDGRCPGLLTSEQFIAGTYKIFFDTGSYFSSNNIKGFYPFVEIVFEIEDVNQHYHVPLLLSPFSYSTYRGS